MGAGLLPLGWILFDDLDNNLEERRGDDQQTNKSPRSPGSSKALQSWMKAMTSSGSFYHFHALHDFHYRYTPFDLKEEVQFSNYSSKANLPLKNYKSQVSERDSTKKKYLHFI